jgi:amino acid adenylation domain-containing protein
MNNTRHYRPAQGILEIARGHPDRTALVIDDESWSYRELVAAAAEIAAGLDASDADGAQPVTGVMAQRHVSSYAGILAARLSGHAYVPLNVNHPQQRNAAILESSGAGRIICGERAHPALQGILDVASLPEQPAIIACGDSKSAFALGTTDDVPHWPARTSDLAYILFTSGSTGKPKGVPIRNSELEAYLAAAGPLVDPRPEDRFSQTFELTFDLSVHDLFICWENGATLIVASEKELRMPAAYIARHAITCWFSVPSLAYQVRLQEDLAPGAFPSLRSSLFCGEALPTVVATEWAAAAPNSRVENWYGPTEATIACSRYEVTDAPIPDDTVPIGRAFDGMELLVLGKDLEELPPGESGELFLAGAQVASGYLNDPEKTAASFLTLPGGKRAYRTGDRAALGDDGNVRFLGRVDNQVKVRGFRIELGEIEAALRSASGGLNAVAMAWPGGAEIATSVVAALETDAADIPAIQASLPGALPEYMVPAMILCVPEFPKNASGTVDRKALGSLLESRAEAGHDIDLSGLSAEAGVLLKSILTHAPLLSVDAVMTADNLFLAGIDSLSFISVTSDIEHEFGLSLDQETVVLLSGMSFDEIVSEARGETSRLAGRQDDAEALPFMDRMRKLLGMRRVIRKPRANRALQFIERFPQYVAEKGAPDVLAFGSSGTWRAFYPVEFDKAAADRGLRIESLNAGFPAITPSGMRMMTQFIKEQWQQTGARCGLVLYEFDPMHVSTSPPSGDINLTKDFFTGNVVSLRSGKTDPELEWLADTAGAWNASEDTRQKRRQKPKWMRNRGEVIAAAYLGDIEFNEALVEDWYAAAADLQSVADAVVCFVHPVDAAVIADLPAGTGSDRLSDFLRDVTARTGIRVLPWQDFQLSSDEYFDVNHANARGGRETLSRQLVEMLAEELAAINRHKG